jgi:hypothetical protein
MPDIGTASQLQAEQERDRRTASNDKVLLELNTPSYTQRESTPEREWAREQEEETARAKAFSYPGGVEEAGGAPTGPEQAPPKQAPEGEPEGPPPEEIARAAQLMQAREAAQREEVAARAAAVPAVKMPSPAKQGAQNVRTVTKVAQAAAAETVVPIFTLAIQMTYETVKKWMFTKGPKKLDANDVACGCACGCVCLLILGLLFMLIFPQALIAAVKNNKWEVFTQAIGHAFDRLFGG